MDVVNFIPVGYQAVLPSSPGSDVTTRIYIVTYTCTIGVIKINNSVLYCVIAVYMLNHINDWIKVGHNRSTSCVVDDTGAGCDLMVVDDGLSSNMADSQ